MNMLESFIIEELKKLEKKKQENQDQLRIYVPLEEITIEELDQDQEKEDTTISFDL